MRCARSGRSCPSLRRPPGKFRPPRPTIRFVAELMSKPRVSIPVGEGGAGQRLDRFLASALDGYSRTQIQSMNAAGAVLVDGRVRADSFSLSAGETVEVEIALSSPPPARAPSPQEI